MVMNHQLAKPVLVSSAEFLAQPLVYLARVKESGETLIVTEQGRPTVEIKQYTKDVRSPLERLRGSVITYENPFTPVSDDDWLALS